MRWEPSICSGGQCAFLLDDSFTVAQQVEAICQRHQPFWANDAQAFFAEVLNQEQRVNYVVRTGLPKLVPRLGYLNDQGETILKDNVLTFDFSATGVLQVTSLIRLRRRERLWIYGALVSHPEWNAVLL